MKGILEGLVVAEILDGGVSKDQEKIKQEVAAKDAAYRRTLLKNENSLLKNGSEIDQKIIYKLKEENNSLSFKNNDLRRRLEDLEEENKKYKDLLSKPMLAIALKDNSFKKTYLKQQEMLQDWIVKQDAFKQIISLYGNSLGKTENEIMNDVASVESKIIKSNKSTVLSIDYILNEIEKDLAEKTEESISSGNKKFEELLNSSDYSLKEIMETGHPVLQEFNSLIKEYNFKFLNKLNYKTKTKDEFIKNVKEIFGKLSDTILDDFYRTKAKDNFIILKNKYKECCDNAFVSRFLRSAFYGDYLRFLESSKDFINDDDFKEIKNEIDLIKNKSLVLFGDEFEDYKNSLETYRQKNKI
jgi:hypothetical protein